MSLMREKGVRSGMYRAIHGYDQVKEKHMTYYDKNKESSYLSHWGLNNLSLND